MPTATPKPADSNSALNKLLGSTLIVRGKAPQATSQALEGARLIAVYVSASWCGPCRSFTPKLADFYKSEQRKGRGCEIIFSSLDRDESSFTEYFDKMPWPFALPYGMGEKFASTHGVRGVPTLMIFARDGTLVTSKGVEGFMGAGLPFPFVWGGERIGCDIKLQGLEKRADLNGASGYVVGAVESSGRFSVRVTETNELVSVKCTALGAPWGVDLIGRSRGLIGLEKRGDLNGSRVEVVGADESTERFIVKQSTGEFLKVRRENLSY